MSWKLYTGPLICLQKREVVSPKVFLGGGSRGGALGFSGGPTVRAVTSITI